MPESSIKCKDVRSALVKSAMSSTSDDRMLAGFEGHIQDCESCRLYAEGLRMAPFIFGSESLYGPALKHQCLTAKRGASGSGDLRLGLLVGVPTALSLLLLFFIQIYFAHLVLAKAVGEDLFSWLVSLAAVCTAGVIAGAACLAALIPERIKGNRLQGVCHD